MDYFGFNFDLQLFADPVTVDISAAKLKEGLGGTPTINANSLVAYYGVKNGTGAWYSSVSDLTEEGATLVAMLNNGTVDEPHVLTVAVGTEAPELTLTGTGVDSATMKGMTLKTVASLSVKASDSSVTVGAESVATTSYASVTITAANVAFDKITALQVSVASGAVLKANGNTYTATADSVVTLNAGGVSTLLDGEVDVAHGNSIAVNGKTYKEAGATATSTARIKATGTWSGTPSTLTPATIGEVVAGASNAVSTVNVVAGGDIIANGSVIGVTTDAGSDMTVNSGGVIAGLDDTDVFTVRDNATGAVATTYTVDDNTNHEIVAKGEYGGVYAIDNTGGAVASDMTVTATVGKPEVVTNTKATPAATVTPAVLADWTLPMGVATADTYYYPLAYTAGGLTVGNADTETNAKNSAYGYFKVVSSATGPKVTVTYCQAGGTDSSQLLSGYTVNFANVQQVGAADLKEIDVTGISAGTLKLSNVPHTVGKEIAGITIDTTPTTGNVDYAPYNVLNENACTITVSASANPQYYKIIVPTSKNQDGSMVYSLQATSGLTAAESGFVISNDGNNPATYTVAFQAGTGGPANLNDDIWAGLKVAGGSTLAAGTTIKVDVTDHTAGGKDKYAVTAPVGVVITGKEVADKAFITPEWTGTPKITITYVDASQTSGAVGITIPSGATGIYWTVEQADVTNGNRDITITKGNGTEPTDKNWIHVVNDGATKVTITYGFNGTAENHPIPLIDLETYEEDGTGKKTEVRKHITIVCDETNAGEGKTALPATHTLVLTDGKTGDRTRVDYEAVVPTGAKVTGTDDGDLVDYKTAYKNAAVLDLSKLGDADTYYLVATKSETADKGLWTVTVGDPVKGTASKPAATVNYFTVKKEAGGIYTVSYTAATEGTGIIPSFLEGQAEIAIGSEGKNVKEINCLTTGAGVTAADYTVTGATTALTSLMKDKGAAGEANWIADADHVAYVATYELVLDKTKPTESILLSELNGTFANKDKAVYTFVKTGGAVGDKGLTTYTLKYAGDGSSIAGLPANTSYIVATYASGTKKVSIEFVPVGTGAKLADFANLAATDMIPINAAPGAGVDITVIEIKAADKAIHYAVSNLPAAVEITGVDDDDTVDYAHSFKMGTANALKIPAAKGTYYYAVTATGGNSTKGVMEVSISTTALAITDSMTAAQKNEIISKAGDNYFKIDVAENGNVEVGYYPSAKPSKAIVLSGTGMAVAVDAADMDDNGTLTYVAADDTANGVSRTAGIVKTYNTSGLAFDNAFGATHPGCTGDPAATAKYVPSYAIKETLGVKDAVKLNGAAGTKEYFEVTIDGGVPVKGRTTFAIGNAVVNPPASGHYFQVTYGSQYVASVVYVNKDGDAKFDLASFTDLHVPVSATGMMATIDTLNIDSDDVSYAVTNIKSTVTVNKTDNDTVSAVAVAKLADNQAITLGTESVAYYAVTGIEANGVITCTLGSKSTTKPDDTTNYFMVERKGDNYEVSYVKAADGTAYELAVAGSIKNALTIDASAAKGLTFNEKTGKNVAASVITIPNGVISANITNAKGGITLASMTNATISYATTVDLTKTGVYYVPVVEDASGNKTVTVVNGAAATTAPNDEVSYLKVSIVLDENGKLRAMVEQGTNAGEAAIYTADATGVMAKTADYTLNAATAKLVLALPGTVGAKVDLDLTQIDADPAIGPTAAVYYTEVTNVAKDSVLTNVAATTTVTTVSTLEEGESVKISAIAEGAAVTYTSAGGALSVLNAKAVSGEFVVSTTTPLAGITKAGVATNYDVSVAKTAGDGKVSVTFDNGKITSITGLEKGETLTVHEGTSGDPGKVTYTYDAAGDYIIRTDAVGTTYAAAVATDANIVPSAIGYFAEKAITTAGLFNWETVLVANGKFYLPATSEAATIEFSDQKIGTGSNAGKVVSGDKYIMAEYATTGNVLKLTPVVGNSKGLVDPDWTYAGTITVKAEALVKYTKPEDANFTIAVTGVGADASEFTNLGANDTVTTREDFAAGRTVILKTWNATTHAVDKTYTYEAGAIGKLEFVGAALKSGTISVDDSGNTTAITTSGLTIAHDTTITNGATIVVADGAVTSIKDLTTAKETVTITAADGSKTVYAAVDANSVTKTFTAADGTVTETTLTYGDDKDVMTATAGAESYKSFFQLDKTSVGYFVDNTGIAVANEAAITNVDLVTNKDKVFIKAENVVTGKGTTADPYVNTLKLTPMVVENGKLVVMTTANAKAMPAVTVNAAVTGPAYKIINYDGSTKGSWNATFNNVAAGSVFKNLIAGDMVETAALTKAGDSVTVNGKEYKALANGAAFTIWSENTASSRIVKGIVKVSDTMNSTDDGETGVKETLTYTKGTSTAVTYGDLTVTYAGTHGGEITSITGLQRGSSATIVSTAKNGTQITTTYEASTVDDGLTVYKTVTAAGVTTVTYGTLGAEGNNMIGNVGTATATVEQAAFTWTPEGAFSTGHFVIDTGTAAKPSTVEVAAQSGKTAIDYKSYGKTVIIATYTKATGGLTLQKDTVAAKGNLAGAATALTASEIVTLDAAKSKVVYARQGEKSLTMTNLGAGSEITGALTTADSLSTVTLKAATDTTPAETVTIGTNVYTAGANGSMSFTGDKAASGTFFLADTKSINAYQLTADKVATATTVTYSKGVETPSTYTAGVTAVVSGGLVTKLTGLGNGEIVTITKTVTDKAGNATPTTETYIATKITSGSKQGQYEVTKTSEGKTYTHTFASETSDILADGIDWTVTNQVTTSTFDWNTLSSENTGYFVTTVPNTGDDKGKYTATVADQTGASLTIPSNTAGCKIGDVMLKVTTKKDVTGKVAITAMELVEVQKNGTFAPASGKTAGTITIDAKTVNALAGVKAPEDLALPEHDFKVEIQANPNSRYTGLEADDKVTAAASVFAAANTVSVNGVAYTLADTSAFEIKGDTTAAKGSFTVKSSLTASADPVHAEDTVTKKITVTGGDGVTVVVATNGLQTGGEIHKVTNLEAGEKVVVENFKGLDKTPNQTTTITTDGTTTKRTMEIAGVPAALTMERAYGSNTVNVLSMENYTVTNKFDFGATTDGRVGIFAAGTKGTPATANIAVQNVAGVTFTTTNSYYVAVGAQKDSDGAVTIKYLQTLKFKIDGTDPTVSELDAIDTSELKGVGVTITAPKDTSITLADDAVKLITQYKKDKDGNWVVDTEEHIGADDNTETKRGYGITVTGAAVGKTYNGFEAQDTIAVASMKAGDKITVNGKEWLNAALTPAAADLCGDGTAKNGTFTLNSTYKTLTGTKVSALTGNLVSTVSTSGSGALVVLFTNGEVKGITGLAGGTTATVATKNMKTGAETTTIYDVKNNGDGTFTITKSETADGVTTITTGTTGKATDTTAGDVVGATFTDPSASVTATFDWTTAKDSGYFAATVKLDESKKVAEIGTVTVEPTTTKITKDNAGEYFVKVTLSADGTIDPLLNKGITLWQVQADGTLKEVALETTTKGTLNITAPTAKALKFEKDNLPINAITVNITGAIKGSAIGGLDKGDKVTTAVLTPSADETKLTEGDKITVNAQTFFAGEKGTITLVDDGVLLDGTIRMGIAGATSPVYAAGVDKKVATDNLTITATCATDKPIIKITDGVVTSITGLKTTGDTVSVAGPATMGSLVYGYNTLGNYATLAVTKPTAAGNTLKTIPLAKGTRITGDLTAISGADNNTIIAVQETTSPTNRFAVQQGVLTLNTNNASFYTTGADLEKSTEDYQVTFRKKAANSEVTVTVANGKVKSITGLGALDSVEVTYDAKTTTYTADETGTKITRKEAGKDEVTAYITKGGDILSANYLAPNADITSEDNAIVGQLSWGAVNGRSTGYFKVTEGKTTNTATIAEQAQKVTVTAAKNKTALYAVANAATDEVTGAQTLTIDALQVKDTNGVLTVDKTGAALLTAATTLTITAPTDRALIYDKGTGEDAPKYALSFNKVFAGSKFSNLDKGDKVVTGTLKAADAKTGAAAQTVKFAEVDGTWITYAAGANGTMTFIGEGDDTLTDSTGVARLLTGTIVLDMVTNKTAYLAGEKDTKGESLTDDVTVTVDDSNVTGGPGVAADKVIVKVSNGAVTSITGLTTQNATVTVTKGSGASAEHVRYTVVDDGGTMIMRQTATGAGEYTPEKDATYKTITKGKELYDAKGTTYKAWEGTDVDVIDFTTQGKKVSYIALGDATHLGDNKTFAKTGDGSDLYGSKAGESTGAKALKAVQDNYYLRVTTNTTAKGTTITALDLMQAGATGKLTAVKSTVANYTGTLTLNSATSDTAYAKVTYVLPKDKAWNLIATAAAGSSFTNYTNADKIATADSSFDFSKDGKSFTLYRNGTKKGTYTEVVSYTGKDGAVAKVTGGELSVTGMTTKGEKVTVVSDLDVEGLKTTEYLVQADGKVQRTITYETGVKTVAITKAVVGTNDNVITVDYDDEKRTEINSVFDWTLDKSTTGYFAIAANGAVTAKAATTKITSKQANNRYLAVELDPENGVNGVVKSIKEVKFDSELKEVEVAADTYSGTITINAPASTALTLNRTAVLDGTISATGTKLVITNAAANSAISNLAVGDTVATASLAKDKWGVYPGVSIEGNWYTAGANGKLSFAKKNVESQDGASTEQAALTGGTIALWGGGDTLGGSVTYVGNALVKALRTQNRWAIGDSTLTVAASTNSSGVTSYTIGAIGTGEAFTVEDPVGAPKTFRKSASALFYEYDVEGETMYQAYALGSKTSVTSAILAKTGDGKTWKAATAAFEEKDNDNISVAKYYETITVDLATLDKRIATDTKAYTKANNNVEWKSTDYYNFVVDSYLVAPSKKQKSLAASVVNVTNLERLNTLNTVIGEVANGQIKTYLATNVGLDNDTNVAQSIKAANGWNVTGSVANDTLTGASSGTDVLDGGAGNDSLVGGGAKDTFWVGQGQDTIKSYGTGDTIRGAAALLANVTLVGSDAVLWVESGDEEGYDAKDVNSLTLLGMGNRKAVNFAGTNYYFGSGKATKAETFTYDLAGGAYYYGKSGLANTVSVGTDSKKATAKTLGDTLAIDLNEVAEDTARAYFTNVKSIDASKSGNRLSLTAHETGSTLKGGTYQSTLKGGSGTDSLVGGSGADMFWFEALSGNDTIKSYTSKNDALYLGEWDGETMDINGITVSAAANNKDIELKKGNETLKVEGALGATKALRISKDGSQKEALSYYVGVAKSKQTNNFTATMDTDMKSTLDDDKKNSTVSISSYYIGSEASNDVLKLVSKTKNQAIGKFDLRTTANLDSHLSSIDVIDTAGLAKGSTIELIGRESGTYTLKGSNNVTETFNLKNLAVETSDSRNNVTITNLSVSDTVELATGLTVSMSKSGSNTICTLKNGDDSLGTLTITGVASSKLNYNSTTGKLTRTAK